VLPPDAALLASVDVVAVCLYQANARSYAPRSVSGGVSVLCLIDQRSGAESVAIVALDANRCGRGYHVALLLRWWWHTS